MNKKQIREFEWWVWWMTEHIPLSGRYRWEGFRHMEGRKMMLHVGIPHAGPTPDDITGTLLDVGCGAISVWEHYEDLDVTAIDPLLRKMANDYRLDKFVEVGPKYNVTYLSNRLEGIGMSSEFDWVWCYNTLDHTEDWQEHLSNCKRVLKPGGVLLLGADVRTNEYDFSEHDDEATMHPGVFTAEEVLEKLDKLGMQVEWNRPLLPQKKFRFGLRARKE